MCKAEASEKQKRADQQSATHRKRAIGEDGRWAVALG